MLPPKFSHGAAKQISHSTDGGAVLPLENVTPYLHATWKPVSYKGAKLFLKYGLLIITFQESEQLNKSSLEIAFQVRINQRGWNRSSSKLPSLLETWPCHVMLLSCILKETWHSAGVLLLSLMEGDRVWGDTLQKFLSTVAAFPFQLCDQSAFCFFFFVSADFIQLPLQWALQNAGYIPASVVFLCAWQQFWIPRNTDHRYFLWFPLSL